MTTVIPTQTSAKTLFKGITRFARNAISFIFKTIAAAALAATILAIALPIVFFAWRAGQPMEAPQFNSLPFYQYLTWRIESYKANSAQYQAMHPNVAVRVDACYIGNLQFCDLCPHDRIRYPGGQISCPALLYFPP